jgi:WD40 repeat protein
LILGHGPELANFETPKPRNGRQAQGLAPLYGFRHDRLKVNSFFIKCAVLPSTVLGTEILAVGSSDACPVLFPTDENAMQIEWQRQRDLSRDAESQHDNARMPHGSETALPSSQLSEARTDGPIPIYQKGAALIEGTTKEVSSVKWADDGTLVSISDDYSIRFWKHDAEKARFLRTCGYFGGHRHMAGWADIENSEELDDDDDPDN